MNLLIDLILSALSVIVGRQIDRTVSTQDDPHAPWYSKYLTRILILTAGIGLLTGIFSFPLGVFSVMILLAYGPHGLFDWIYSGLLVLLPFLNLALLIWIPRHSHRPSAIIAAIGMVVSMNLPVWALPWLNSNFRSGFRSDTFVLAFCILTFAIAAVGFIWSGLNSHPTPIRYSKAHRPASGAVRKIARQPRNFEEPDFLDTDDSPKRRKRKASAGQREQRIHS